MATVNEKIKNALDDYNKGLKTKLDNRFVKKTDFATDTYVTKVAGKTLSSNDFTDADKLKLNSVETDTYVTKVAGKNLSTNDFTDNYKSQLDGLGTTYAKKTDVAGVYKYKGTVANFAAIASDTSIVTGSVYNISVGGGVDEHGITIKSGDNVAKTDTGWDVFAGAIDLSSYAQIYIGPTQPTDTSVIWFDTSSYST